MVPKGWLWLAASKLFAATQVALSVIGYKREVKIRGDLIDLA
jgi:hypothetical protein